MHRVGRKELFSSIYGTIRTMPEAVKRKLRGKLPHEGDEGASALAKLICDQVDNAGVMVIAAEMVGEPHVRTRGKFGVTEPDPCP